MLFVVIRNKVNYQKADLVVISVSGKVSKQPSDGDNGNYIEYKRTYIY